MQISPEGLIRLSISELLATPMKHLISGVDVDGASGLDQCGCPTSISGYTEWVSSNAPTISIGWDWYIQSGPCGSFWTRVGLPSSNVLLIEARDNEEDWDKSRNILATVVDAFPWREHLPNVIAERYS
jgi:hypothetical protein